MIITFNEEAHIARCLQSLNGIADEIIVVDSFSTDNTCAIVEAMGGRVIQHAFEGHIQQKNFAAKQANSDWVLSLDGDECLSESLRDAIAQWKKNSSVSNAVAFWVKRLNHLAEQPIKGCGWYPDKKIRLWKAGCGEWSGTNPHDRFEVSDAFTQSIGELPGDLLHFTYSNFEQIRLQALKFGKIGAIAVQNKPWPYLLIKLLISPQVKFFKNFFIKRGVFYGFKGLVICYWQWRESLLKYGKGFWISFNNSFK